MHLAMVARRRPICIDREATIEQASRLMRDQRTDALVVTEPADGKAVPAGVVCARDIVMRVLAVGLEPEVVTVGDIMWSRAAPAHLADSVPQALERLHAAASDVLAVVDGDGRPAGVVSIEDLMQALACGGINQGSIGTARPGR